uniref:DNA-directed DNA polymerase n=1 Tax=Coniophora olivacea TaxID=85977 RepID=A0A896YU35_9AGAM
MKINSPDFYNALKDYNFDIKNNSGYFWKQDYIFTDFINKLYEIRLQYPKTNPMNLIAKLLMNSSFGRFGMKPINTTQAFLTKEEFLKISENYDVTDWIDLGANGVFVTFVDPNKDTTNNSAVHIASAVTSYARVLISKFKNNPSYKLYYSDTDSIFIDKPLDPLFVGKELGQFKLEYIFKDVVFLAPKIYAGVTTEGNYICKIKGYKNAKNIAFEDMKSLLKNNANLELSHNKWFRSLDKSNIQVRKELYNLMVTQNKRDIVYSNNSAVNTKALKL